VNTTHQENTVDTRQLKYFIAVVDHRGFSRAAEHLQISQPSLSQAISGFEQELGVPLFHRVGRGVVPTLPVISTPPPPGWCCVGWTVPGPPSRRSSVSTGRLELITMASPGVEPLTTVLRSFAQEYPGIVVNVAVAAIPEDVLRAVRSGASEVGLLGAVELIRASDLTILPVEAQPLVLVSAPGGPFADYGRVTAADLDGRRLVVAQRGSLVRQYVEEVLASGIDITVAADVDRRRSSILPLVLAGLADAVLPEGWSNLARKAGADVIPIDPTSHLHISLVHRPNPLTPVAAAFIDLVTRYAQQQVYVTEQPSPADRSTFFGQASRCRLAHPPDPLGRTSAISNDE
jgi:DNA-binding transcriptional LysR family regulator